MLRFKFTREELLVCLLALVLFIGANALMVSSYPSVYFNGGNLGFWSIFFPHFHVSGYDVGAYIDISNERIYYTASRHPFWFSFLFPFYWLNHWLMRETEINFAVYIMATLQVICATLSFMCFYRTFRRVLDLRASESLLFTLLLYSFAHILLATMVPDHFCFSLFLLALTIYVAGIHLKNHRRLPVWKSALLFFFTAGITVTNGIKTCLAVWFVNGKRAFSWLSIGSLLFCCGLLYGIWSYQCHAYEEPQAVAISKIETALKKKDPHIGDKSKAHRAFVKKQNGKTLNSNVPLLKWTDVTTSRWQSAVENLFGESIQFHDQHLLEDVQISRPVFVHYTWTFCYVVEVILVLFLFLGIWCGRHSRLLWMIFSWAAFDMIMHLVMGFGLNEVYIMTAHWAFLIPFAMAFLYKALQPQWRRPMRIIILLLTLYLFIYNGRLLTTFLL